MAAANRKIIAQATLMIMSSMFLSIGHMYGLLLLWKMKMKQTENNIMLYFLQKLNYLRSKEKLRKIRNLRKKRSCWQTCGRDDVFRRNIRQVLLPDYTWKKNFRMLKGDFAALVGELKPYISPNPLSPNHRALNAEKKVAITLYCLKDTASIGMVVDSFVVAICTIA